MLSYAAESPLGATKPDNLSHCGSESREATPNAMVFPNSPGCNGTRTHLQRNITI